MKKFITFEGGEGSGKSTQSKLLSKSLFKIKENNLLTREPGGTIFAEKVRKLLVNKDEESISLSSELLLIYAARCDHLEKKIIPALKNKTVICDRYIYSTYCYQSKIKNFSKILKFIHKYFGFNLMPDLTFLLDLPPDEGVRRSLKVKKVETRFEKKNKKFHESIRKNYLELSRKNKKILKLDASLDKINIHRKIVDYLNSKNFFSKKLPYML